MNTSAIYQELAHKFDRMSEDDLHKVKFTSEDTAMLASILTDISQSLAVIADCCLDKWQKDQVDRFMSMSQEDRKIFSDYVKQDETMIINCLRNAMPKQEKDEESK